MPAAAKGTSAAAAKAFVRYWVAVLDYSGPAGKSERLRELSSLRCIDCDAIADAIDSVHKHKGRISGKGWSILKLASALGHQNASRVVRAQVQVHPQVVVTRRGAPPRQFSGGKRLKVFYLEARNGAWKVTKLDQSSL